MKNKQTLSGILPVILLIAFGTEVYAQGINEQGLKKQVESAHFIFIANSASPLRGNTRFLDASHDVRISKDSIISYLPYFGVADQPPLTSDEAGIRFTSTKFEYKYDQKSKAWNVQIAFKDQSATRQFYFTIYENGNTSLDVTSNFRDPISFRGYIKKQ